MVAHTKVITASLQGSVVAHTKVIAASSTTDMRFAPGDFKYIDSEGEEWPLKSFGTTFPVWQACDHPGSMSFAVF